MNLSEFLHTSSETLWGLIFGAFLAALPTISMYVIEFLRHKSQQKHELRMRRIDLLESPRLAALQEYSRLVGALIGSTLDPEHFSVSEFRAAHQRAAMFVSPETYAAMLEAYPVILAGWDDSDDIEPNDKLHHHSILKLNACLHHEMVLESSTGDAPPSNLRKRHHY